VITDTANLYCNGTCVTEDNGQDCQWWGNVFTSQFSLWRNFSTFFFKLLPVVWEFWIRGYQITGRALCSAYNSNWNLFNFFKMIFNILNVWTHDCGLMSGNSHPGVHESAALLSMVIVNTSNRTNSSFTAFSVAQCKRNIFACNNFKCYMWMWSLGKELKFGIFENKIKKEVACF
jgi:hypothetical protein